MKKIRLIGTLLSVFAIAGCQAKEVQLSKEDGEKMIAQIRDNAKNYYPKSVICSDSESQEITYLINYSNSPKAVKYEQCGHSYHHTINLNQPACLSQITETNKTVLFDGTTENETTNIFEYEFFKDNKAYSYEIHEQQINDDIHVSKTLSILREYKTKEEFIHRLNCTIEVYAFINPYVSEKDYMEQMERGNFTSCCGYLGVNEDKATTMKNEIVYTKTGSYKDAAFSFVDRKTFEDDAILSRLEDYEKENIGSSTYDAYGIASVKDCLFFDMFISSKCITKNKNDEDYIKQSFAKRQSITKTANDDIPIPNEEDYEQLY